jgi:hypothetical protein
VAKVGEVVVVVVVVVVDVDVETVSRLLFLTTTFCMDASSMVIKAHTHKSETPVIFS